jgi:acyl carrier protein
MEQTSSDCPADIGTMLRKVLREETPGAGDGSAILAETHLKADLNIDSLTFIRCIIALETQLGTTFDDAALMQNSFDTVGELEEYIRKAYSVTGQEQ